MALLLLKQDGDVRRLVGNDANMVRPRAMGAVGDMSQNDHHSVLPRVERDRESSVSHRRHDQQVTMGPDLHMAVTCTPARRMHGLRAA